MEKKKKFFFILISLQNYNYYQIIIITKIDAKYRLKFFYLRNMFFFVWNFSDSFFTQQTGKNGWK